MIKRPQTLSSNMTTNRSNYRPAQADPPKRKRNLFQFRLRTLLIGVALLAVPCAYVGWQAKIVAERKSLLERSDPSNGPILTYGEVVNGFGDHAGLVELPPLREWLGDKAIDRIDLIYDAPPSFAQEVRDAFPEAAIFQIPPDFRLSHLPTTKP
jgi:hypothetical protein